MTKICTEQDSVTGTICCFLCGFFLFFFCFSLSYFYWNFPGFLIASASFISFFGYNPARRPASNSLRTQSKFLPRIIHINWTDGAISQSVQTASALTIQMLAVATVTDLRIDQKIFFSPSSLSASFYSGCFKMVAKCFQNLSLWIPLYAMHHLKIVICFQ